MRRDFAPRVVIECGRKVFCAQNAYRTESEKALTPDSSGFRPKPAREVKPAHLAYGTVKTAGGSIDIRIMKGRQKLRGLGLDVGEDVLVVAAPGEGILLVHLPKVVTESTIPEILDRIKIALDKLNESYQYTMMHQEQLFRLLARPRMWAKKVRILRETKKKSSAKS